MLLSEFTVEHGEAVMRSLTGLGDMSRINVARKLKRLLSLQELKQHAALSGMRLLQRGNRLSIMPVSEDEWNYILQLEKETPER